MIDLCKVGSGLESICLEQPVCLSHRMYSFDLKATKYDGELKEGCGFFHFTLTT